MYIGPSSNLTAGFCAAPSRFFAGTPKWYGEIIVLEKEAKGLDMAATGAGNSAGDGAQTATPTTLEATIAINAGGVMARAGHGTTPVEMEKAKAAVNGILVLTKGEKEREPKERKKKKEWKKQKAWKKRRNRKRRKRTGEAGATGGTAKRISNAPPRSTAVMRAERSTT